MSEATPTGAEEDAFDEKDESAEKAEWFRLPQTIKQRKILSDLRISQTKEMVRQGLASPDPNMRGIASTIRVLEAQILALGGTELIWPDTTKQRAVVRR